MCKILTIGGKEYRLKYAQEAAFCGEAIDALLTLSVGIDEVNSGQQGLELQAKCLGAVPKTALTLFYAGLLEHHGPEGDGSVSEIEDAKELVRQYFDEHKDDGTADFYSLLNLCIDQINADKFIELCGIDKMVKKKGGRKKKVETADK